MTTIRAKGEREAEDAVDRLFKKDSDAVADVFIDGKLAYRVSWPAHLRDGKPSRSARVHRDVKPENVPVVRKPTKREAAAEEQARRDHEAEQWLLGETDG